jgi:hypothetical protein
MPLADIEQQSIEALEDEITTLAAHLSAATDRLLELLAEFDRLEGWGGIGMTHARNG